MLSKRIIPCLDVHNKQVTKGVKFQNSVILGDPVELGEKYYLEGADELVFYDITASAEGRSIDIDMVKEVAKRVRIPFAVGGGISTLEDISAVLLAGAEKVSVNSLAVKRPEVIDEGAKLFVRQCIVLGVDPIRTEDPQFKSGYEVTVKGFRERTGRDLLDWVKEAEDRGVGEIVVNSVDADGTREGFELGLTKMVAEAVSIPVVASGGAGNPKHIADAFTEGNADAAIIAGMIHTGDYSIPQIKKELEEFDISIRKTW